MKAAFAKFDKDGDGRLDSSEVLDILRRATPAVWKSTGAGGDVGAGLTTEDAETILADFDRDGNGTLEIKEFCVLMTALAGQDMRVPAAQRRGSAEMVITYTEDLARNSSSSFSRRLPRHLPSLLTSTIDKRQAKQRSRTNVTFSEDGSSQAGPSRDHDGRDSAAAASSSSPKKASFARQLTRQLTGSFKHRASADDGDNGTATRPRSLVRQLTSGFGSFGKKESEDGARPRSLVRQLTGSFSKSRSKANVAFTDDAAAAKPAPKPLEAQTSKRAPEQFGQAKTVAESLDLLALLPKKDRSRVKETMQKGYSFQVACEKCGIDDVYA